MGQIRIFERHDNFLKIYLVLLKNDDTFILSEIVYVTLPRHF